MNANQAVRGVTLIEMMIALLLGLFLVGGVLAFFSASNASSRVQSGISRLLENGRYAGQIILDDLRLAGAQYCSSFQNMVPNAKGMNYTRPMFINVADASDLPKWIPAPGSATPWPLDPAHLVQGYECDGAGVCIPALPDASADINVVPAAGVAVGERARKTDVVTVRFLQDKGVSLSESYSMAGAGGGNFQINSTVRSAPLEFEAGDLAMVADCANAEIFATSASGSSLSHNTRNGSLTDNAIAPFRVENDARIFNFSKDFQSVTFFLGIKAARNDPTEKTSALYRIVNGGNPEEIVEGVERMDFRYTVLDGNGQQHVLTANQVELNPANLPCPPVAVTQHLRGKNTGCLWRAVQAIELSLLVNSADASTQANEPYRYSPDGSSWQSHAAGSTLPSGLNAGNQLRREFTLVANLHNVTR